MAEQPSAQAVQQVTEAQLYEILGRVYVSWQIASKERGAYLAAAQQNYEAAQKAQRDLKSLKVDLAEMLDELDVARKERDEAREELARDRALDESISRDSE